MPRAVWNGAIIAESDRCESVEGNVYFPPESVDDAYLRPSDATTVCGWKGTARYLTLEVGSSRNEDAAWYYPDPKPDAAAIKDMVAFWRDVTVEP